MMDPGLRIHFLPWEETGEPISLENGMILPWKCPEKKYLVVFEDHLSPEIKS